jgi:hypothetical protein
MSICPFYFQTNPQVNQTNNADTTSASSSPKTTTKISDSVVPIFQNISISEEERKIKVQNPSMNVIEIQLAEDVGVFRDYIAGSIAEFLEGKEYLLQKATYLVQNVTLLECEQGDSEKLLRVIQDLSMEVIRLAVSLMKDVQATDQILAILYAIKDISEDKRENVVNAITLKNEKLNTEEIIGMLKTNTMPLRSKKRLFLTI